MSLDLNNKIIFSFILFLFLVGTVSAFDFDNVVEYTEGDKKISINNCDLWLITCLNEGEKLVDLELITPKINYVVRGEHRHVMILDIDNYGDNYLNGVTNLDIYTKSLDKINKEYHWEYAVYEEIDVETQEIVCKELEIVDGIMQEDCTRKVLGMHKEMKETWVDLEGTTLPKGKTRLALVTDVAKGDYFDGIPTLFGERIDRWAVWTEALNTEIVSYYTLNESSGTIASESVNSIFNGSGVNLEGDEWSKGIIGNGFNTSGVADEAMSISASMFDNMQNWTISIWVNATNPGVGNQRYLGNWFQGSTGSQLTSNIAGGVFGYSLVIDAVSKNVNSPDTVNADVWHNVIITYNGTEAGLWINGTFITSESGYSDNVFTSDRVMHLAQMNGDAFTGTLDEVTFWNRTLSVTEISDLWNDGEGITFNPIAGDDFFIVTLQNPTNHTNTTRSDFNFDMTSAATGSGTAMINTTLLVWNPDKSLFGSNFTLLTGNISNSTNLSMQGLQSNTSYEWNYELCSIQGAFNIQCNMSASNFTLNVVSLITTGEAFTASTIESTIETFELNVTLHNDRSISLARLVYNNTEAIPIVANPQGKDFILIATVTTPSVTTDVNIPFFWNITLDNTENFSSSNLSQVVSPVRIDNCTTFSQTILNLSIVDEELQTLISPSTLEISLNVSDESGTNSIVILGQNTTLNPFSLCLENQLSPGVTLSFNSIIKYFTPVHAIEYYNIINFSLTNETMAQNITLFDLNISDTTEFQLTFTGSDYLPVENALVFVDRQYIPENTFKTVELPKTDSNGQTVLHLVRNDIIYNIRVSKNGIILGNFENLIAFCEDFTIGDCKIILDAGDSTQALFNYDEELGITFTTPTFDNNTRDIRFNFLTSDGTAKTVLMNVTRSDIFGNRTVCEDTLLSSGGTLSCNVPSSIDDADLRISVFVNGEQSVFKVIRLELTDFGVVGYLVLFIMSLSLILMFSSSKTGVLFGILISFAGAIGLGLITSNLIGLGASGLWLIIIVMIGIWKLNKDRIQ